MLVMWVGRLLLSGMMMERRRVMWWVGSMGFLARAFEAEAAAARPREVSGGVVSSGVVVGSSLGEEIPGVDMVVIGEVGAGDWLLR